MEIITYIFSPHIITYEEVGGTCSTIEGEKKCMPILIEILKGTE